MTNTSMRRLDWRTHRLLSSLLAFALLASVVLVTTVAQAVHDIDQFELDKNASNDLNVDPVGYLASNINATATSINVCQTGVAPAAGDTILIRAERMTVTANNAGSFGGNCPGDKRTYTVARGADGTIPSAQSGGANNIGAQVSLLEEEEKDGPDWDEVFAAVAANPNTTCASLGLVECAFIEDGIGPTTFTGGNTKDHLPISGWKHTSGASPDKGEILNAYAAKAINDDDQILYFGMDRYAVDGSTDIGFWFFQSEVSTNEDGTFSGEHLEGDVLILGTFTQGGATSNIRVFEWVDSGGNEQENIQGPTGEFGDCADANGDAGCATVNNTTIEVPWNYQFKGASEGGWVPAGGFFEGGVNLTDAGLEGCFSTFLAETRSSPEITAVLKDFALGDFEACDSELTTTPSDGAGDALVDTNDNGIPDTQIGTGSAGVNVTDAAELDIKGTSTWSGTLDFFLCGPIETGTCDEGGVLVDADVAVDQDTVQPIVSASANLTEVGRYCWRGEFTSNTEGVPDADDSTLENECFEVLPVTPTLSTQAVDAEGVPLTGDVAFGDPVYDLASLTGTAHQPGTDGVGDVNDDYTSINATMDTPANGTITFTLVLLNEDGTCGATATGSGNNPETGVLVTGDDDYQSSGFTPDAPGDYTWQASYSGDDPNTLGKSHNDNCDDEPEHVTVLQLQPTMDTDQSFIPNDSATVSVEPGAGDLDGTATFHLFVDNDGQCDVTADASFGPFDVFAEDDGLTDPLTDTVSTDNDTAYGDDGTTFHWVVVFESDNDAHQDVTSDCTENSSIAIDNGETAGS